MWKPLWSTRKAYSGTTLLVPPALGMDGIVLASRRGQVSTRTLDRAAPASNEASDPAVQAKPKDFVERSDFRGFLAIARDWAAITSIIALALRLDSSRRATPTSSGSGSSSRFSASPAGTTAAR